MNRYDFNEEFIKGNKIKLIELFNELHTVYAVRNDLYESIKEHKAMFNIVGMDFSALTDMLTCKTSNKVILNKKARRVLPEHLIKAIGSFVYLSTAKLSKLEHEILITRLMCDMPPRLYFKMQYWFNREIANSILRGGVYGFGQGLSRIGIKYVKRKLDAKPIIDWGESIKLRNKLISEGHTVKTKDTPEGIKWLLHRTDDGYCFWRWNKREAFTPNKKMYKFRAIATNNECTEYNGTLTQEQILDKSIGPFDKMMALLKLNANIILKYDF